MPNPEQASIDSPQADPAEGEEILSIAPNVQELAAEWSAGKHMEVASRLMFSPASYAEFVDLCFSIGQDQARELGSLLDELADTENIPVPKPSGPQGNRILQRVAALGDQNEPAN